MATEHGERLHDALVMLDEHGEAGVVATKRTTFGSDHVVMDGRVAYRPKPDEDGVLHIGPGAEDDTLFLVDKSRRASFLELEADELAVRIVETVVAPGGRTEYELFKISSRGQLALAGRKEALA